ncbi:hypothetical protein COO60DRAFT_491534 [Scenedesmus sp. NREL 46B-D3]|nr:hypothetical protein COO60DRAFT_491534 [Scenedesmus sp. NREL 46B-D3]
MIMAGWLAAALPACNYCMCCECAHCVHVSKYAAWASWPAGCLAQTWPLHGSPTARQHGFGRPGGGSAHRHLFCCNQDFHFRFTPALLQLPAMRALLAAQV